MANKSVALDQVFHALADPTRRAVLRRLAAGPASVQRLAQPFKMALPSFVKHIAVLEGAGLIATSKSGRVRSCTLRAREFSAAEQWLAEQRRQLEQHAARLADYAEALAKEESEDV